MKKIIFIGSIIVILFVSVLSISKYASLKDKLHRIEADMATVVDRQSALVHDSIRQTSTITSLELTIAEAERYTTVLHRQLDSLKLRNKRLIEASVATYNSNTVVQTYLRDTVYVSDSTLYGQSLEARVFEYSDPYTKFNGILYEDTLLANIQTIDTVWHITYYKPKTLLFGLIKYGRKKTESLYKNANPNAVLEIQEAEIYLNKNGTSVNGY